MPHNAKHSAVKVDGVIVGAASMDTTDKVGIIHMQFPTPEACEKVWGMLNDPEMGYAFADEEDDNDLTFEQDLAMVINRHSMENESGTPDFVLAGYLAACLENFNVAVTQRGGFRGEEVEFNPSRIFGVLPAPVIVDEVLLVDPE